MVDDRKIAWHAGKSKWKNFTNLNESSLESSLLIKGISLDIKVSPINRLKSLISLCKILEKKFAIKKENFLGHSDIAPLRKSDPGEKFPWKKLSNDGFGKWYKKNKDQDLILKKELKACFLKI